MKTNLSISISLLALGLAACGDNLGSRIDAHIADGATPKDSPHGFEGVQLDAATPATARIWVVGDMITNNTTIGGGFDDTTALPLGGANAAPPVILPSATTTLADSTGYSNFVFDATADGSKIAFVGDLTTVGTFDLYVANADGSNPTLLVAGQTGVEIASILFSPDGSMIAYTADSIAINGGYDMWIVNTTGTPVPVQVSPARPALSPAPANQDVGSVPAWSSDSKYLGFTGDLTLDTFNQAYCTDTSQSPPVTVELLAQTDIGVQTSGANGVGGTLKFDNANNAYFSARVTTGSTQFQLFQAKPDGTMRTDITSTFPVRTLDNTAPDIGGFSISADGATLVVNADTPVLGNYDMWDTDTATLGAPKNLTNIAAPGHANFTAPFWFSPDGTMVAYLATFESARNEPYISSLDGSDVAPKRLVSVLATCLDCGTGTPTPDVTIFQWKPDGTAAYIIGDITNNNVTRGYVIDPTMTDQTPTLAVDVPDSGDLFGLEVRVPAPTIN